MDFTALNTWGGMSIPKGVKDAGASVERRFKSSRCEQSQVVYDHLEANPGQTFVEVADSLGIEPERAKQIIAALKSNGWLASKRIEGAAQWAPNVRYSSVTKSLITTKDKPPAQPAQPAPKKPINPLFSAWGK